MTFQPGEGLIVPTQHSTWAVYWSGWQYVYVEKGNDHPIDLLNGQPDQQGIGFFARVGFADKETSPVDWAVSGGIGGRGIIPTRENDSFGLGYYYNDIQSTELFSVLGVENSTQRFECFYHVAITPACRQTFDLQVVRGASTNINTATVLGLRANVSF